MRWRVNVSSDGYVESTPIVAGNTVYFSGDGVYAVDAGTGAVRSHNALGWNPSIGVSPPALVGDLLAVPLIGEYGDGALVALDAMTGSVRWQVRGFNQIGHPVGAS
jgi:outer membrane protein assembly factor BamB